MGSVCGTDSISKEEKNWQKTIEKQIREDKKHYDREVKLLLLGTGESGKSTVVKQLRLLYLEGFSAPEKEHFKEIVYSNVFTNIRILCRAATSLLGLKLSPENQAVVDQVCVGTPCINSSSVAKMLPIIQKLWDDEAIRTAYDRRSEFQLSDSAEYFFERLDVIGDTAYVPTDADIIRAHSKTSGIMEISFAINSNYFRLVDVGGQRSERRKWIHCFQSVTSIIFFVALSEYDLQLYEDESVMRMHESVKLFGEIVHSRWFHDLSFMLFLNKDDLFRKKVRIKDLAMCFPDYKGGLSYRKAIRFIKDLFRKSFKREETPTETSQTKESIVGADWVSKAPRCLYIHVTTATDTNHIKFVFESVRSTIFSENLFESGF